MEIFWVNESLFIQTWIGSAKREFLFINYKSHSLESGLSVRSPEHYLVKNMANQKR